MWNYLLSFLAASLFLSIPIQALALGGQLGTKFAIDAPWRLEPRISDGGRPTYGPIPISITILDANFSERTVLPGDKEVGKFTSAHVLERWAPGSDHRYNFQTTIFPAELSEIERKVDISRVNRQPEYERCRPSATSSCDAQLQIGGSPDSDSIKIAATNEWHATFWYTPKGTLTPGQNIHLEITVLTRGNGGPREWRNNLVVHLGEAPLPRFSSNWLYGDLHYHSQMTDNEGESGYSYRNVVKAMGAMGLDFVFATDHASGGEQAGSGEARDLNPLRFEAAKKILYGENGVNSDLEKEISLNAFPAFSSRARLPQIFMGEELDAIPLMSAYEQASGTILFGDGQKYRWFNQGNCIQKFGKDLCQAAFSEPVASAEFKTCVNKVLALHSLGGGATSIPIETKLKARKACIEAYKSKTLGAEQRFKAKDAQGIRASLSDLGDNWFINGLEEIVGDLTGAYNSRQHLVYFPYDAMPTRAGWVADNTGKFGGATRSLVDLVSDISSKGIAFLAHPADGVAPGGASGPDIIPYSRVALDVAWRSQGVVGLQLWNENRTYSEDESPGRPAFMTDREFSDGVKRHIYHLPWIEDTHSSAFPWKWRSTDVQRHDSDGEHLVGGNGLPSMGSIRQVKTNAEIYHGSVMWDKYLRKGLDPEATRGLSWLAQGQPRKWFAAGGSDGHGDFNYRREGRPDIKKLDWSDTPVSDGGLGKPRNLVLAGEPQGTAIPAAPNTRRTTNRQVIDALASGKFSITDGPALRIVIDRNRNGVADEQDFQMGSTVHRYPGEHIPVIVQWLSTPEFGRIKEVHLYVGNKDETYAPANHGPDRDIQGAEAKTYNKLSNFEFVLPVNSRDFALKGQVTYYLSPRHFGQTLGLAGEPVRNAFYVRAFAKTVKRRDTSAQLQDCSTDNLHDSCGDRQALTNPIWINLKSTCQQDPSSIDGNGNRMPDVCEGPLRDPCSQLGGLPQLNKNVSVFIDRPLAGATGITSRSCRVYTTSSTAVGGFVVE